MNILGTQNVWKPRPENAGKSERASQILKNRGYISIFVEKVFFNSRPNFFQQIFGGTTKLAVTTTAVYKTPGQEDVEAKIVLGTSTINAKAPSVLSKSCIIALNVPTHAEGIELKTTLTSLKQDNFERTIDLLSNETFQTPLSLDPTNIGKVVTIGKLVGQIFNGDPQRKELEGSFAGLISKEPIDNPVDNNRLTDGYLILISNNDIKNPFWNNFNPNLLSYHQQRLLYKGQRVELTHIVYSIHYSSMRGENEQAAWSQQYEVALSRLDDLFDAFTKEEQQQIKISAIDEWKKANLLLDNDPNYTREEIKFIRKKKYQDIKKRYAELVDEASFISSDTVTIAKDLLEKTDQDPSSKGVEFASRSFFSKGNYADQLFKELEADVQTYLGLIRG